MATSPKCAYIRFFARLIILLFAIILIRLGFLMLVDRPRTKAYDNPKVAERVVRGTIYDRNQRILAIQTPYWGVYFHLNAIKDLQLVSEVVAPYVQMSPQAIMQRAANYTTYAQIKAQIDEQMVQPLLDAIQRNKLHGQVNVEKRLGRTYPALFHASQLIGFTNTEQEGIEGLELSLERFLNPYPKVGNQSTTYGEDITLTLDMDIQYALDVQLQLISNEHRSDYAMGIVLDATNGDILAMGSYPWYDSNNRAASTPEQRKNYAVNHLFEPGSVFKLFSIASILELDEADTSTTFHCDGSYTFSAGSSNITINCTSAHGEVDVSSMIAKSCNGAISHWALQTGEQGLYSMLSALGFTQSWDIFLPSRANSIIAPVQRWSARSAPTIAFGQELLTTALHLVVASTALTESGDLLMPHLILRRTDVETQTITYQREKTVVAHVFNEETTKLVREGMLAASLAGGTGTRAYVQGIDLGIKTGTAQLWNPESQSYDASSFLASSLVMVPIDNPRYIIYVGTGNPKGSTIYGANIAAPAIKNIVEAMVSQGKLIKKDTSLR